MTTLPTLSNQDSILLSASSRNTVRNVLSSLRSGINIGYLLNRNNKYRHKIIKRLKEETKGGIINIDNDSLKEYIAASTLLHCFDGWKYFGRALNCHLLGDNDICRHLGYYAELRAVMSILAVEGIGVFDKIHFMIDNKGNCNKLRSSYKTHDFVWLAFENWINTTNTIGIYKNIIKPNGIAIDQWFQRCHLQPNLTFEIVWKDLLKDWGLDLKIFISDREARNESSYRPNNILERNSLSTGERLNFIINFWKVFEPSSLSRFNLFDMQIMVEFLRRIFKSTGKIVDYNIVNNLAEFISRGDIKIKEDISSFIHNNIKSRQKIIINYAKATRFSLKAPSQHLAILSRAAILLRLATGSVSELLNNTGIDSNILSFWLKKTGVEYGLWKNGEEPDDCADLWADVDSALSNVDPVSFPPESTVHDLWFHFPYECHTFSSCERIALWGMSL